MTIAGIANARLDGELLIVLARMMKLIVFAPCSDQLVRFNYNYRHVRCSERVLAFYVTALFCPDLGSGASIGAL